MKQALQMVIGSQSSPQLANATSSAAGVWMDLTELLLSCSHALRDEVALRSQSVSLSGPQFALLWACASCSLGLSQRDLALRLALSAAHISGLVEQLGERGLIAGERAAHDRRRQIWRLTNVGRAAVERVVMDLEPFSARLDASLDAGARQQLAASLRELAAALGGASSTQLPAVEASPPLIGPALPGCRTQCATPHQVGGLA